MSKLIRNPQPERPSRKSGDLQMTLFGFEPHPLLDEIRNADINSLTPIEAMRLIESWQRELGTAEESQNLRN